MYGKFLPPLPWLGFADFGIFFWNFRAMVPQKPDTSLINPHYAASEVAFGGPFKNKSKEPLLCLGRTIMLTALSEHLTYLGGFVVVRVWKNEKKTLPSHSFSLVLLDVCIGRV